MRPKRDPVPRAKEAWWWLGGLLTLGLAGGAVVVAGIALWENIDIRQLTPALAEARPPVPHPLDAGPPARAQATFEAVLFESERNAAYFDDPSFYGAQLDRWRALIERAGGRVRVASDAASLAELGPDDVLVLAEAPCLASAELAQVGRHLNDGGSVVANWALGVRDGSCEWRGWAPLLDVTGAEAIREIPPRAALFLTVPARLAVSPGIDPGTRIELRPDPVQALRMDGARVYWSDWALNPAPDGEGAGADVAVAIRSTPAGGRVAWFGVRAGQAATPGDSVKLARLLENGIRWAGGTPYAAPSPWPGAAQAALVFALDVEGRDTYVNARDVAAMFEVEDVPVTFFAVSALVADDAELGAALASAGEVGTQTVDHTPLAGLTRQDQALRLGRAWRDIEAWTEAGPMGLRPPEEAFDSTTLWAWRSAGGRYLLATNEARSAAPEVHVTDAGPVILLPRLMKDDYTVVVRDITLRSTGLAEAFVADIRKMRAIGGLGVVAGHTQIIEAGPRLEAFRTVADSVRAQGGWWVAEAREVAKWWLARSQVELRWVAGEAGEELLVSAGSEAGIDDLWIDVVAPTLPGDVIPMVDGLSAAFMDESWGMRVAVGSLAAGDVRRISFVVAPER